MSWGGGGLGRGLQYKHELSFAVQVSKKVENDYDLTRPLAAESKCVSLSWFVLS